MSGRCACAHQQSRAARSVGSHVCNPVPVTTRSTADHFSWNSIVCALGPCIRSECECAMNCESICESSVVAPCDLTAAASMLAAVRLSCASCFEARSARASFVSVARDAIAEAVLASCSACCVVIALTDSSILTLIASTAARAAVTFASLAAPPLPLLRVSVMVTPSAVAAAFSLR